MATLVVTNSVVSQEMFFEASLLCEGFVTDGARKRFEIVVHSHVQLKPDFVRINFVTYLALPVFQQAGALLDMVFQMSKDKKRLIAGSTEESLGNMSSLMSFQARQVGALDPTLIASKGCFHPNLVHLQLVLVEKGALLEVHPTQVTR